MTQERAPKKIQAQGLQPLIVAPYPHGNAERLLREVIELVSQAIGLPLEVRYSPARALDVPVNVLAVGRAEKELGWSPKIPLAKGIVRGLKHAQGGDSTEE